MICCSRRPSRLSVSSMHNTSLLCRFPPQTSWIDTSPCTSGIRLFALCLHPRGQFGL